MRILPVLILSLLAAPVCAQDVNRAADLASWGTAAVNPAIGIVSALRSDTPKCKLLRLGLSEAVGNGVTLTLKHFVRSERPCAGCAADGMPSGHTMNSVIGGGWRYGFAFSFGTAQLRRDAHRHTFPQVLAGAAIGVGAEAIGHLVKCP